MSRVGLNLPPSPYCPFNSYINCHSEFVCKFLCHSCHTVRAA